MFEKILIGTLAGGLVFSFVGVVVGGVAQSNQEHKFMTTCLRDKAKSVSDCRFDYLDYKQAKQYGRAIEP